MVSETRKPIMWMDYNLYVEASHHYNNFILKHLQDTKPHYFIDFLAPHMGQENPEDAPWGTVRNRFLVNEFVIYLPLKAVKVVEALAGPYHHALLKAHYLKKASREVLQKNPI
jgi:hypothetical protein